MHNHNVVYYTTLETIMHLFLYSLLALEYSTEVSFIIIKRNLYKITDEHDSKVLHSNTRPLPSI